LDLDWQYKVVSLVILFVFSAFFSGSEVALFSVDRKKLAASPKSGKLIERYLFLLLEHPRRLLVSILIGNTIVNVAASIVAVTLALELAIIYSVTENLALTIQIILLTILITFFGELVPKVWARKNPAAFSRFVAVPLYWIGVLIYPVSEALTELIRIASIKLKFNKAKTAMLPEEISELADLGHERGTLEEEEHGLIQSIVSFRSVAVHEVMTPRVDIVSISVDSDLTEVLKTINDSGHSRIPLYKENLDEIVGILYAKDLLPLIKDYNQNKQIDLLKIARKVMFIPRIKMINDLMHEFQEKKMHIAIVVDEYGGTAGLISLEDIIEEIIGEIRDEYDKEENQVTKLDDNTFLVLGKFSIDELNELLGTTITPDNGDFETVAGLVLNHAEHIPKENYSFMLESHKFTVKEILNKRIKKVLIEKIPGE
jgi:putative hemolysin